MEKNAISGKRKARKLALQALYQWRMSTTDLAEIEAQFRQFNNMEKVDGDYFCQLLYGVPKQLSTLEGSFIPLLDRELDSLNPVELTVLRLSSYELLYCPELPYKVVLNEAIALTREFGTEEGHRYVNGVLHHLAQKVRAVEIHAARE